MIRSETPSASQPRDRLCRALVGELDAALGAIEAVLRQVKALGLDTRRLCLQRELLREARQAVVRADVCLEMALESPNAPNARVVS